MDRSVRILLVFAPALALALAALPACSACKRKAGPDAATCLEPPPERSGEATYYDADGSGKCSFEPGGDRLVAAMNGADFDNAAWCGGCIEVDGPSGTVVVRVVDSCPGCASGDLDLSQEAFATIAPLVRGRVDVRWREVPCDVTGPIRYRFKDGSDAFWTGIQIRNHRYPIVRVSARRANGEWKDLHRESYNYFVSAAGLGDGPFALRVTDDRGHTLEDLAVPFVANGESPGAAQAGVCH
jgi:expansin (peptidoglycan-binding protein)